MAKDVLVVIPAFNEEWNIGSLLTQLIDNEEISSFCDILVVNDASADETSRIAKRMGVSVVTHVFNLGYGSALQIGYKYAVRRGYQYIIQIDADGQHDVCNVPALYRALCGEGCKTGEQLPDIVLGSRFVPGSESFKVSGLKKAVILWFRMLIKLFTGTKITDPTSGLQGLNRDAFLFFSRYNCFDIMYPDANTIIQATRYGLKYREIASIMHERAAGESMHSGIIGPMIYVFVVTLSIINIMIRDVTFKRRIQRTAPPIYKGEENADKPTTADDKSDATGADNRDSAGIQH